jgi:hypothetical protein
MEAIVVFKVVDALESQTVRVPTIQPAIAQDHIAVSDIAKATLGEGGGSDEKRLRYVAAGCIPIVPGHTWG